MKRREFIAGLGGAAAWPFAVQAQQQMVPRVGVLGEGPSGVGVGAYAGLLRGLAETGFVEGRNLGIDQRFAEGHVEQLPALAGDLVIRNPQVIVAFATNSALAAKAATRTIPIVFNVGSDPVEVGLVASLNRPGGNVTGVANLGTEISAKRVDLLHKLVPAADLIAMLVGSTDLPYDRAEIRGAESAGRALGVRLLLLPASNDSDVAAAFPRLVEHGAGALLVGGSAPLTTAHEQIISLAARHSIPTMFYYTADPVFGGLVSYGPDVPDSYRQTGIYVGRILKGEKPADLPVQRPTRFPLLINLKTAKALGLAIPPNLLALADEVIE